MRILIAEFKFLRSQSTCRVTHITHFSIQSHRPSQTTRTVQHETLTRMMAVNEELLERNVSCHNNYTIEDIKTAALTAGIPGIVCFALSIVGLVAELIFIYRYKNSFLLRLFIYLSVAVTITVGGSALNIVMYINPNNRLICEVVYVILTYGLKVRVLLIFSINIVLIHKVFSSALRPCRSTNRWTEQLTKSIRVSLEVVFVLIHFGIPVITMGVLIGVTPNSDYWIPWGMCHRGRVADEDCGRETQDILLEFVIERFGVPLIDVVLSIVCILILIAWLCWLQTKHVLKAQMKTVLKEMGLFVGFLITYCLMWVLAISLARINTDQIQLITFAVYPISFFVIPLSFFIYMCVSLYRGRQTMNKHNSNVHINPHTTGLETAPSSTRISLPSDTADHAPNLLTRSGENLSEITPLVN